MLKTADTKAAAGGRVSHRVIVAGGLLVALALLAFVFREPLLGAVARWLIVETPLQPAVAIIPLSGSLPFRTIAAARVFQEGWAPRVLVVPSVEFRKDALHAVGVDTLYEWEESREVLIHLGVPPAAITVAHGAAINTLQELCLAAATLQPADAPVIIVTSPYHTRRAQAIWQQVTQGKSPAIMRTTEERFPGDRWWVSWQRVPPIAHEYLGLVDLWTRWPLTERDETGLDGDDACGARSGSGHLSWPLERAGLAAAG